VDDSGGLFWFSGLFRFFFSFVSFRFDLDYLVFFHLCFRSIDLSRFIFSLPPSFWFCLDLVEHLLCRSFVLGFVSVGVLHLVTYPSTDFYFVSFFFRVLSLLVVFGCSSRALPCYVGYLFVFRLPFVAAFMGLSVHAFTQRITPHRKVQPFITLSFFSFLPLFCSRIFHPFFKYSSCGRCSLFNHSIKMTRPQAPL